MAAARASADSRDRLVAGLLARTGMRAGVPGQFHSMIRSKNWRTVRIPCRCVSAVIVWPPPRGWAASHTL